VESPFHELASSRGCLGGNFYFTFLESPMTLSFHSLTPFSSFHDSIYFFQTDGILEFLQC
jgi:hypothetical protein